MENKAASSPESVTIQTTVNAPVEKVWEYFSAPEHITKWTFANDDWHAPKADNDLRAGGSFSTRMEAKDGSMGFDFSGTYDDVKQHERIAYTMGDSRKVDIRFKANGDSTEIVETFDAENSHPVEFQRAGWQSILDNFKRYVESSD
jgi:uncharacterized protein YndB with AHSA1/START domain